jgi:hypothetical protein
MGAAVSIGIEVLDADTPPQGVNLPRRITEIRRPCEATMRDREPQVRDAGLEIVLETRERTGEDVGAIGADSGRQL